MFYTLSYRLPIVCVFLLFSLHYNSDGIGRTGAFMCVYSTLERVKIEGVADIFQYIKGARFNRPALVQNVVSLLSNSPTTWIIIMINYTCGLKVQHLHIAIHCHLHSTTHY